MSPRPTLTVLDLAVVPEGVSARETIAASVQLARDAERWGYHRYWLAEHHLTTGLASASPLPVLTAAALATGSLRVGSGATLTGHRTAIAIAEDFATLAALAPGRVDLGLGRSPGRGRASRAAAGPAALAAARGARTASLLQQEAALAAPQHTIVRDVLDLLADRWVDPDGTPRSALPGGAPDVETWVLGSNPGESAQAAGELGLPFAVNHHMNPGAARSAAEHYRSAFVPSERLREPRLAVSAEVIVAPTMAEAEPLVAAHLDWVARQREGEGLVPFPAPGLVRPVDGDRGRTVADREETLVAGPPATVVPRLEELVGELGADELVVSTVTHGPRDRSRSYRLLAEAWRAG